MAEVIAKLKEVGLSVGAQKTHWTRYPKMMDKSIMVDGLAVLWEEVLEFVGSKVCFDRNARHATAHRSAQANTCMTKWRPVLKSSWLPRMPRLNIVQTGFPLEFECLDDGQGPKRQNCKLECEGGGERHRRDKAPVDGNEPVVETVAQDWSPLDREMQHERVDCHQRTYAQLGWSCCQNGLQRNLWRKTNGLAHTHSGSKSTGGRTWLLVRCPNSLEMQTVCRNLSKTTRASCILLKTVEAGNSFRNGEGALQRWSGPSGTHVRPA